MNLASRKTIEYLCRKYGFWPQRKAGQNFLISEKVLHTIVEAARLTSTDTILEIGGGFGTLTTELVKKAGTVVTVELDKRLVKALKKLTSVNKNLSVIAGDVFKQWPVVSSQLSRPPSPAIQGPEAFQARREATAPDYLTKSGGREPMAGAADGKYKLVASLPYNITSLVLRHFLENEPRPSEMVVLVQKEVAERVVAKQGEMSLLAVAVQFYGAPEIVRVVPKENFWPAPAVDSAILRIQGITRDIRGYQGALGGIPVKKFFSLVRIGFSAKRKQLHNNLSAGLRFDSKKAKEILLKSGVDPQARAQDLAMGDWIKIAYNVEQNV